MFYSPEFYKFSELSIHLAQFAASNIDLDRVASGVDLFAGQGVVGIEFLKESKIPVNKFEFIEKEIGFISYLEKNIASLQVGTTLVINHGNVFSQTSLEKFDLIILNPPFFQITTGRHPSDQRKRDCHFMNGFDLEDIWQVVSERSRQDCNIFMSFNRLMTIDDKYNLSIDKTEKVGSEYLFKIVNK